MTDAATGDLTAVPCTPEQRQEWQDMHDRMDELYKAKQRAEDLAVRFLQDHVKAGAMKPKAFGLPDARALEDYRQACALAHEAATLWAEWQSLHELVNAHPYTLEVRSRHT